MHEYIAYIVWLQKRKSEAMEVDEPVAESAAAVADDDEAVRFFTCPLWVIADPHVRQRRKRNVSRRKPKSSQRPPLKRQ